MTTTTHPLGDIAIAILRYASHDRACPAYVGKHDFALSSHSRIEASRKCSCGFTDTRIKLQKAIDNEG